MHAVVEIEPVDVGGDPDVVAGGLTHAQRLPRFAGRGRGRDVRIGAIPRRLRSVRRPAYAGRFLWAGLSNGPTEVAGPSRRRSRTPSRYGSG
jgi:hypothetical protein